jgi:hypothetical protein
MPARDCVEAYRRLIQQQQRRAMQQARAISMRIWPPESEPALSCSRPVISTASSSASIRALASPCQCHAKRDRKVLVDAEIEIQCSRLKHDAEAAQLAGRAADIVAKMRIAPLRVS